MAYTEKLYKHQSLIWQDEGDACDAVLVRPEASGNATWCVLQQGVHMINLNQEGAKALIKELHWFLKNQDAVIKECK